MNNTKIDMGKISYINASPVFYGLDHGLLPDWLNMVPEVPSVLNRKILAGNIEISPISAAFYAMNHKDLLLLPDLSISCHGPVMSVILASNYPIDNLTGKQVMFSQESASSASFLKMIFNQKKVVPELCVDQIRNTEDAKQSADAVLVIGDTALTQPWGNAFEYCIDLGQLWYEMTTLPFVFAVWAVRRSFAENNPELTSKVHQLLLDSRSEGDKHLDEIIDEGRSKLGLDRSLIKNYFNLLHCDLNDEKIKAMGLFFDSLLEQDVLKQKAKIEFFTL